MKKIELMKLMSSLNDDDEIFIEIDGGDYWGNYLDNLQFSIKSNENQVGHPGGKSKKITSKKYGVFS